MSEETLLIVSLALCFGMVVIAANTGFSAAFGAFIMGSILAETIEAESIDRLVKPVKDLFGAIFFVSVGMMVDPAMIGRICVAYSGDNYCCHSRTSTLWYIWSCFGRPAFEDGHAMWVQSDTDWGVCLYHCLIGSGTPCDE